MAVEQSSELDLSSVTVIQAGSGDIAVGDAHFLFGAEFIRSGSDLIISGADGTTVIVAGYFNSASPANLVSHGGAMLTGDVVALLAGPLAPGQYAQAGATQDGSAQIGTVVSITGSAVVTRADGTVITLVEGAPVFAGDVVQTATGSTLGLAFLDGTVFNMAEDARMVLNSLVYEPGGSNNAMLFSLVQGGFTFFAGEIAPTGDMKVTTPVATLGIRGTSPKVIVLNGEQVQFSLLKDPGSEDVGSYDLFSLTTGALIGNVSGSGSNWTINAADGVPREQAKTGAELVADQIHEQQLNNTFTSARPIIQQLQQGGGQDGDGQDGGDGTEGGDNAGSDQEASNTTIQSSGINVADISASVDESIEDTTTTDIDGTNEPPPVAPPPAAPPPVVPPPVVVLPPPPPPPPEEPEGPTVVLPNAPVTTEDTSIILTDFEIQDTSGAESLEVTITAQSTITLASTVGLIFVEIDGQVGDGFEDEMVAFTGSLTDINNALNGMIYNPSTDNNTDASLVISVSNDSATTTETLTVSITAINDAPSGTDNTIIIAEDGSHTFAAADFGFTDLSDGDNFANLTITSLPLAGTLKLSGIDVTMGQVIAAADIANLVYAPAANASGTGYASFTFVVQDDGSTANGGEDTDQSANTITLDVTAVNDPPVADDETAMTNEDVQIINIDVLTGDTDIDGGPLTVTGATALNGTVTVNGNNTLNYTPNTNFNGTDTIVYDISDGNGGTDSGAVTVTVDPVNDAPSGTDNTITIAEDGSHTFAAADFGFNDPIEGDNLLNVIITSLPVAGTLKLSGISVMMGQVIALASIASLVFAPAANATGTGYASFTFAVQDDGGTANGGVDTDQSANTITVDVTGDNDAPVVDQGISNQNTTVNSPLNFMVPADAFSDIDVGDNLTLTAELADGSALPSWLSFNGTSFTGTPLAADLGLLSISVTATDIGGLTATTEFNLVAADFLGSPADDTLTALPGGSVIAGGPGNDTITGLTGNDQLFGQADDDTIRSGGAELNYDGVDFLFGGDGNDTLISQGGFSILIGGPGNDTITVTTEFSGDELWDFARAQYNTSPAGIVANLGATSRTETINGQSVLLAANTVSDGFGDTDTIGTINIMNGTVENGTHVIRDSDFDDYIFVDGSYMNSFGNWIEVRLSDGDDYVDFTGMTGTARISWQNAADGVNASLATGMAFDNDLSNGDQIGNDTFIGANFLRGSRFDDALFGNGDDNTFRGSKGNDTIDGAGGSNWINHGDSPAGLIVDLSLASNQVIDDGFGTTDNLFNIQNVRGTLFDDQITGDSGPNVLRGSFGNDHLMGGGGDDTLRDTFNSLDGVFAGDDILDGGTGNDSLRGGGGRDTYVFRPGDGNDTIEGFRIADGDQIDVSAYGLTSTAGFTSITFASGDTNINFNGVDTVTVEGIDLTAAADIESLFVFVSQTIQIAQLQPGNFDDIFDGAFFDAGFTIFGVTTTASSGTAFTVVNDVDASRTTIFTGTGFIFDGFGDPTGGTIDTITFIGNAATLATAAGLSVLAVDLFNALDSAPVDDEAALDAIFGQYNIDYTGSGGADDFGSDDNNDILRGGDGNDTLRGDGGNDTYIGGAGDDTYVWDFNDGYDNVDGTGDDNRMDVIQIASANHFDLNWSWDGANFFVGVAADDNYLWEDVGGNVRIDDFRSTGGSVAYFEADTLSNSFYSQDGSTSRVYLTNGITGIDQGIYTEIVLGTENADVMTGGGGFRDYIYGAGGDDILMGDDATISDLRGGAGNDTLLGANNTDRMAGGQGDDILNGGGGTDMARYDRDGGSEGAFVNLSSAAVTRDFEGVSEMVAAGQAIDTWNDTDTLISVEDVRGSGQADVIIGSSVANFIRGRGGDDLIEGMAGIDDLRGGDGNDTIIGGDGADNLRGGADADEFVFLSTDTGSDTIHDYVVGDGDELNLTDLLDVNFDPNTNEASYILAQDDGFGNAIISVDGDGAGTGQGFVQIATLNGIGDTSTVNYLYNDTTMDSFVVGPNIP